MNWTLRKLSNSSQNFPQFQVDFERSQVRCINQGLQPSPESIQGPQAHHLFELKASHRVDAESSARYLQDEFLTTTQDLAAQIANQLAERRRPIQNEARTDKFRIASW